MLDAKDLQDICDQYAKGYKTLVVDGFLVNEAKDAILLQRRSSGRRLFPNCWDATGGHVDEGEDLFTALKREINEESTMDLTSILAFTHHFVWPEDPTIINFQFLCTAQGEFVPEAGKVSEVKWVKQSDLPEILKDATGAMSIGITKAFEKLIEIR